MSTEPARESGQWRVLDTVERLSEILFGVLMALTFTGSISVATDGPAEIRTLLVGAIGCNLAWGIIDGFMYLLHDVIERNRARLVLRRLRRIAPRDEARRAVEDVLPDDLTAVMQPHELDQVRQWLARLPDGDQRARLNARSFRGALAVFLLVALSTFPLVVPFIVLRDPTTALRASHAVGLLMLFGIGSAYAGHAGLPKWRTGIAMVGFGLVLVALTIALGG